MKWESAWKGMETDCIPLERSPGLLVKPDRTFLVLRWRVIGERADLKTKVIYIRKTEYKSTENEWSNEKQCTCNTSDRYLFEWIETRHMLTSNISVTQQRKRRADYVWENWGHWTMPGRWMKDFLSWKFWNWQRWTWRGDLPSKEAKRYETNWHVVYPLDTFLTLSETWSLASYLTLNNLMVCIAPLS